MIFKKNGRLYGDIESLLNECCEINQYCFQCALHGKAGTKSCAGYAAENPEEVARLLNATVIKDKPITAEAVEKYGEDVKRRLTRADILHAAEKCVCGQREQDYGTESVTVSQRRCRWHWLGSTPKLRLARQFRWRRWHGSTLICWSG